MSAAAQPPVAAPALWRPLAVPAFAGIWGATVASNTGTWMHDVGAAWLMTSLSPSPGTIALVQAATTLPVFLLALPAGALADMLDRRRLLLACNLVGAGIALLFALAVLGGAATVPVVLGLTFALGCTAAFMQPTWQAVVPQLVDRPLLPQAIALNSLGINVARAIGPALAGLVIATLGLAAPFLLNAASFLLSIAALWLWRPPPAPSRGLPPEQLVAAMVAGLRYARASRELGRTLLRAVSYFAFASAFWALLPVVARFELQGGPGLFGLLQAAAGVGAVAAAMLLPLLKQHLGAERIVLAGSLATGLAMLLLGVTRMPEIALLACLAAGGGWLLVLSSLQVAAQAALPDWVRARGLSIYLTVFFGTMAAGSTVWGQLAGFLGTAAALALAGVGLAALAVLVARVRLPDAGALDLAPSSHWPQPALAAPVEHDRGPVMVTIEYRVGATDRAAFLAALDGLSGERRRDGAYQWQVFEDAGQPGLFTEVFLVASWLEHLRQHERVSRADAEAQDAVRRFHQGDAPPLVRHHLAADQGGTLA